MKSIIKNEINYSIFNPSKNITALVESIVQASEYGSVTKTIMKEHKEVEQVGFVSFNGGNVSLTMAGGEFCGNATMSAAVLYAIKNGVNKTKTKISVYGLQEAIEVDVEKINGSRWTGIVNMPKPIGIKEISLEKEKSLPVVFFQNIAHVIIECDDINDSFLKNNAEMRIKDWCDTLDSKALGIMYFNKKNLTLTPLVYVKSIDTLFWENSCASGTEALGAYLSINKSEPLDVSIKQPGGDYLNVSTNKMGDIFLKGSVEFIFKKQLPYNNL